MIAAARYAVPAAAACALVLGACKSAHEQCAEARGAATAAWNAYIDPIEAQHKAAAEAIKNAQASLKGSVEPRIADEANRIADQRYIPGTPGWSRGREIVLDELCRKDAECSKLKRDIADGERTVRDAQERIGPAKAARSALVGKASGAKAAANEAIIDPERPALQAAQIASGEAEAACEDVVLAGQ